MDDLEPGSNSVATIHWLVRAIMWLLVALCVALPCFMVLAPLFLHPAVSATPATAWQVLWSMGVVCGACVLGAGFLGTLAWRGHSVIQGSVGTGNHFVAPRLPWYTRVWAGIVCAGVVMLLIAQVHRTVSGDASWLSLVSALVMVALTFQYLSTPVLKRAWSEATVRQAARFGMTPQQIHADVKREHDRRRDA